MWRVVNATSGAVERVRLSESLARKLAGIFNAREKRDGSRTRFRAELAPPGKG